MPHHDKMVLTFCPVNGRLIPEMAQLPEQRACNN